MPFAIWGHLINYEYTISEWVHTFHCMCVHAQTNSMNEITPNLSDLNEGNYYLRQL